MNETELEEILKGHKLWLDGKDGGVRANLSGADLSDATLSGADLIDADLPHRFISVSLIGSRKGMTTYSFEYDKIWCGCFTGTLKEFAAKVRVEYPDKTNIHRIEYDGFIAMIRKIRRATA